MKITDNHRVSVVSKYLGPTNHRGSRVKVMRSDHRQGDPTLTVSWDHALDIGANHCEAIRQFIEMLEWDSNDWIVGHAGDGKCVGVQVPREVTS
jgi:hypothetical protein